MANPNRVHRGVPTGGRFAEKATPEANVTLKGRMSSARPARSPSPIEVTRELSSGRVYSSTSDGLKHAAEEAAGVDRTFTNGRAGKYCCKSDVEFTEKDPAVPPVAAELHEQWRAGFAATNGAEAERWKDDGHGGKVDIAHTAYKDLPAKWQAENRAAALSAVKAVSYPTGSPDLEGAAELIHNDWRKRNGSWAPDEQMAPYERLPEAEKEKDRQVAITAARITGNYDALERWRGVEGH